MPESSPAAWRFPMRASTALCRLFSGLLNIDSALALIRLPCRDDADDFFAIVFLPIGMHDQEDGPRGPIQSRAIAVRLLRRGPWARIAFGFVKNTSRCLEVQAVVLRLVDSILTLIPFEAHRITQCITNHGARSMPKITT